VAHDSLFFNVCLVNDVYLEPHQECIICCEIDQEYFNSRDCVFEPYMDRMATRGVLVAPALVSQNNNMIPVRMINATSDKVKLYSNTTVGRVERIQSTTTAQHYSIKKDCLEERSHDHLEDLFVKIEGLELRNVDKSRIVGLLKKYSAVFSRNKSDIGYCPLIKHEIFTEGGPPVHDAIR
jgi:hypothetical protein